MEAWTFLEMITPGEIPSLNDVINKNHIKGQDKHMRVVPISQSDNLKNLELLDPTKFEKRYTYYINSYRNYELVDLLRNYFQSEEEIINKNTDLYYSFTFDVDEKDEYVDGSLFIPYVQLMVDDIKKGEKISYDDFTDRYNEKKTAFEEELNVIFENGVDDEKIKKARNAFNSYFSLLSDSVNSSYLECIIFNKNTKLSSLKFNSFFLDDLQTVLKKGENDVLSTFIDGKPMKIDIDENRKDIEKTLELENLPLGRWPSPVNHRLSLMQQISVNNIINGDELISSVNGPPGTGKTTLLKDIFAELIVQRSIQMAAYDDPTKAFAKSGKQDIEGKNKTYKYNVYELDEKIAKYSMVVASCNNGAVENISKELPLLGEVVRYGKEPTEKEREEKIETTGIDPMIFYEYDLAYAKEAEELEFFTKYAENLLDDEKAWGMFSGAFGKGGNIQNISYSLQNKTEGNIPLLDYLKEPIDPNSWDQAVKEFNDLREEIENDKKELQEFIETMKKSEEIIEKAKDLPSKIKKNKEHYDDLEQESNNLEKQNELLKQRLDNLPRPNFIVKMINQLLRIKNKEELEIREQIDSILKSLGKQLDEKNHCKKEIKELNERKRVLDEKLKNIERLKKKYKEEEISLSTDEFWKASFYSERQKAVLWQSHELNFKRGMLFLKGMKVHKVFLHKNNRHMKGSIAILQNIRSINLNIEENLKNIGHMWKSLHLLFPVMSTTFASLGSMYRGMDKNFIDYLFIDEAGQASPQQAVGGLWRCKKAIIVGDPIQIEPVVTLDETILSDIRKAFDVSEHYIGSTSSVQTMADYANPIGTFKGEGEHKERIGIPLWVHRRCIEPMFSISNEIAYENKMVLAKDEVGHGHWYDIRGKTQQAQYVKEQGEFIVEKIEDHFQDVKEDELPSVFVITPFTAVRTQLIKLVTSRLGGKIKDITSWANKSIGTVHTFQGKEADIVYFVTGTDLSTDGAANWSCMKPNLLNVATTRAKEKFYVVGDIERFKTKQYYDVIVDRFKYFEGK